MELLVRFPSTEEAMARLILVAILSEKEDGTISGRSYYLFPFKKSCQVLGGKSDWVIRERFEEVSKEVVSRPRILRRVI
jgi:hypothetical protein